MKRSEIYAKLLNISEPSYYRWKVKHKLLLDLLEDCFSDQEIKQYISDKTVPFYIKNRYKQFESDAFKYLGFISNEDKNHLFFEHLDEFLKYTSVATFSAFQFKRYLLDKLIEKEIDKIEFLDFDFDNLEKIESFITANIESNWILFNNIMLEKEYNDDVIESSWAIKLHKILFLSKKLNIFSDLFYGYDREKNMYNDEAIIPTAPSSQIYSANSLKIYQRYDALLSEVLIKLENNDFDFSKFKKYNVQDINEFAL